MSHAAMFGAEAGPPNGATHVQPAPPSPGFWRGPAGSGGEGDDMPKRKRTVPATIPGGSPGPAQMPPHGGAPVRSGPPPASPKARRRAGAHTY